MCLWVSPVWVCVLWLLIYITGYFAHLSRIWSPLFHTSWRIYYTHTHTHAQGEDLILGEAFPRCAVFSKMLDWFSNFIFMCWVCFPIQNFFFMSSCLIRTVSTWYLNNYFLMLIYRTPLFCFKYFLFVSFWQFSILSVHTTLHVWWSH